MPKFIISDASCLIALDNIEELEVLKGVYGQIVRTEVIANEFGKSLPNWIKIQNPTNSTLVEGLGVSLDEGEASAIALALELKNCTLILDDLAARRFAKQLNIEVTGTLGVLVKAKRQGVILSVKAIIEKLKKVNFRISAQVEEEICRQSGE